ncbi:Methylamine utilization protein MauG precursor [Posidoniimonas corsicana]|uniref:Methylamine utilization protein MauG n=1 Tax=Posidoniimonas corsicana TaxID=1938618 RepID=A0A5C5VCK8_9BACT|nr:cytochrome c peroxidase [Posidoniimonas corsicana]TWT35687.1 Methylamine utilization protein MauG precursor [Posidoniimonas corsicana]
MRTATIVALAAAWPLGQLTAKAQTVGVPALPADLADFVAYAETDLPAHFRPGTPSGAAIAALDNTPADNPLTNAGATLGRVLFYDPRLSHNNSTACASCHQQEHGFTDPDPVSEGFDGELTDRNSMGLANARYNGSGAFFWDERSPTLEHQVLQPIQNPVEMGITDLGDLEAKLAATDFYPQLFEQAFGTPEVTSERMSAAMSQFVRSMVSYNAKFDQAFREGGPPDFGSVLTVSEERGHQLFADRCDGCHRTNAQVSVDTHNIGLDLISDEELGTDEGAGDGEFKVPSLRNVAVRGTYMHDGRFDSLEDVIRFYSTGIRDNPNLDPLLTLPNGRPVRFNFIDQEVADLIAFLGTLTDDVLLTSEMFSNPFVTLAGDYNDDGLVDADDYLVWREAFGGTDNLAADGNGDGLVDSSDYSVWRDNLGATWESLMPSDAAFAAVPAPSGAALLVAAAWCWRSRRPRKLPAG